MLINTNYEFTIIFLIFFHYSFSFSLNIIITITVIYQDILINKNKTVKKEQNKKLKKKNSFHKLGQKIKKKDLEKNHYTCIIQSYYSSLLPSSWDTSKVHYCYFLSQNQKDKNHKQQKITGYNTLIRRQCIADTIRTDKATRLANLPHYAIMYTPTNKPS